MKHLKQYLAGFLCAALPSWGLYAAVPDMPLVFTPSVLPVEESVENFVGWDQIAVQDELPAATVPQAIVDALFPQQEDVVIPQIAGGTSISLDNLSDEELEEELQDELLLDEDTNGSHSTKKRIIAGLLILSAALGALILLLSGSGGGSGSGSGDSSGNGGNSNNSNYPPAGGGGGTGGGNGTGPGTGPGTGGGGGPGVGGGPGGGVITPFSIPLNIPNNPEPSTLFLLGLGLLLPFFRRKG